MIINQFIEVEPGDKCWVQNYRSRYKTWEPATCDQVNINIDGEDKLISISYDVTLDRESTTSKNPYYKKLTLRVGTNGIKPIR